jgi:hypothetical protein
VGHFEFSTRHEIKLRFIGMLPNMSIFWWGEYSSLKLAATFTNLENCFLRLWSDCWRWVCGGWPACRHSIPVYLMGKVDNKSFITKFKFL